MRVRKPTPLFHARPQWYQPQPGRVRRRSRGAWLCSLTVAVALAACALQAWAAPAPVLDRSPMLVLQEGAALRIAPKDGSPEQARLTRGEALELRGERLDWLQVWDYRRERGGFVRRSQLLQLPSDRQALRAQLQLALPQEGQEGLALALGSAFVQAAPAAELSSAAGAEVLDAIGQLGQRIAASSGARRAGLLDVAARYGLRFEAFEQGDGSVKLCDAGDAYRALLKLPAATPAAKARAALALTQPDCRPTTLSSSQRLASDEARAALLQQAPLQGLPQYQANRLRSRRAAVAASRAFLSQAPALAAEAQAELAQVEVAELAEDDQGEFNDAAMRVNAVRWLALPAMQERQLSAQLQLRLVAGSSPGEQCLQLRQQGQVVLSKCSVARLPLASATLSREGRAIAMAAQPLDGWRELWLLRAGPQGWTLDVLPPSLAAPGLGYVEFAGWVPGGREILLASESRAEGRYSPRRFIQMDLTTMSPLRQSPDVTALGAFQRWADPAWRGASVALR